MTRNELPKKLDALNVPDSTPIIHAGERVLARFARRGRHVRRRDHLVRERSMTEEARQATCRPDEYAEVPEAPVRAVFL